MKIGIIGAGWLGFPIALELKKTNDVWVSTTSVSKRALFEANGLQVEILQLPEFVEGIPDSLKQCDCLLISVPPFSRTKPPEFHKNQIESLLATIPVSTKVIYTSSSSVYPDEVEIATEDFTITAENTGHAGIFGAEKAVLTHNPHNLVLRLAGLTGYDRFLARHFAGKKDLKNGNWPVNLIHRDDVVAAIVVLLTSNKSGIYNICAPNHPTKKEFYTQQCTKYNLPLPEYREDTSRGKTVSSEKLVKELGFSFQFPDPFEFSY